MGKRFPFLQVYDLKVTLQRMKNLQEIYQELLCTNQDAFDQQFFEVAYHALSGAMRCALEMDDGEKLIQVQQLAREQCWALKAHSGVSALDLPAVVSCYNALLNITNCKQVLLLER